MKHLFTLSLILGSICNTYAQKTAPAPAVNRYYYFTGTIDKYPVAFHIFRENQKFTGHYYYTSTEVGIDITGTLEKDNFLQLSHNDNDGKAVETFAGKFKDTSFSGTWSSKGKLLTFRAVQMKDDKSIGFDIIHTSGSKKLSKDENGRFEVSYSASTVWPVADSRHPALPVIKAAINKVFDKNAGSEDVGKAMLKEKKEILSPGPSENEMPTYDLSRNIQVEYQNEKLLSLSSFIYYDGGGVHGNYATEYICFDLVNKRQLTITDVLDTLACKQTLRALLEKKFRVDYGVKKEDPLTIYLFDNTIAPGANFMLTSKGITFSYAPYAIGPYALGEVSLRLTFKELSSCLKPGFKQLIE